ncbi:hypothetical protein AWH69_08110 [Janibacter melonis]|uniref:Rod shape-determining protein MreD n=1 Tax=Janibacter melonis TaxID=262209 RepID=A0A176QE52_9MICO|nr:hypothetical protein [Janibacter melonis]OAB87966.1 hypothetical protein AWH69_08110 [Janibacter melonis]
MTRSVWLWRVPALAFAAVGSAVLAARGVPVPPTLVLLVVVAIGMASGPADGILAGLVGGWMSDLVPPGGEILGLAAATHAVVGAVAGAARRVSGWPLWWPGAVAAVCWVVVTAVPVVRALTTGAPVAWLALLGQLVGTVVLAVLLTPVLLALDRRVAGRRPR